MLQQASTLTDEMKAYIAYWASEKVLEYHTGRWIVTPREAKIAQKLVEMYTAVDLMDGEDVA